MTFGNNQEDQEGQECPHHGVLEDFGCLDRDFVIETSHMIRHKYVSLSAPICRASTKEHDTTDKALER